MGAQLALFEDPPPVVSRPRKPTPKQLRSQIRGWQRVAKMWKTGGPRNGHVDYCLRPGTDEGDCSTAFRREKAAEADSHAEAIRAQMEPA